MYGSIRKGLLRQDTRSKASQVQPQMIRDIENHGEKKQGRAKTRKSEVRTNPEGQMGQKKTPAKTGQRPYTGHLSTKPRLCVSFTHNKQEIIMTTKDV